MSKAKEIVNNLLEIEGYDDIYDGNDYYDDVLYEIDLPRILYHLTPKDRLPSILKLGLKKSQAAAGSRDLGLDINFRGIYLTSNPRSAIILTPMIGEASLIHIDTKKLDIDSLSFDPEDFDGRHISYEDFKSKLESRIWNFNLIYKKDIPKSLFLDVEEEYDGKSR